MTKRFFQFGLILIFSSLIIFSGCTSAAKKALRKADDKTFARYGYLELVRKNNDLYLQKPDGSNSLRMTFTPRLKESNAFILSDSGYLVYSVLENPVKPRKYYIQSLDIGIKSRKTITEQQFNRYLRSR